MSDPEAPRSAHEPLRRIAWIHLATTAVAIGAIAGVLGLAPSGPRDPTARAAILAAVLAAGVAALVPTLRVLRRELGELPAASSLQNSESVLQKIADDAHEVLDQFEWPVFYVCDW